MHTINNGHRQISQVRNMIFKAQPTMTVIIRAKHKNETFKEKLGHTFHKASPKQHIHCVDATEREKSFKSRVVAYFLRVNLLKTNST